MGHSYNSTHLGDAIISALTRCWEAVGSLDQASTSCIALFFSPIIPWPFIVLPAVSFEYILNQAIIGSAS
ncbi:hypothetical protein Hypma_001705 [Hypsizygus marmoreus]|uniref:Uncharacterized protein n=1 Tax=Hypsizygus marmoreus TaxID=39966 RepID=A0A369J7W5_HYPMA|nr:hypothetical protein Hypma_001705 [Hypsizygus marmoreus]